MAAANPDFAAKVRAIFAAPFLLDLGIELLTVEEGVCESRITVAPRHAQQDGFVHAGVIATLADHTAGGAAASLVRADQTILTVEFKVNLLRPAVGDELRCRATVLRGGRTLSVAESEVRAGDALIAKATVTLAVVDAKVGSARSPSR